MSQGVKPGDRVMAMWQLDEGTHYVIRGISKLDAEGQALGVVLLQAELRENYQQINQLQDQIAQLQNLIHELMKQLKPAGQ
jgi:TolA-binding protein